MGGPLGEKNPKWLQDDYVKFLRFGAECIAQAGCGVESYVTNHGYIDNPTFRGLRQRLIQTFDSIDVLDLHGNSTRGEHSPDGSSDENVFDIKQGVAIFAAQRRPGTPSSKATVRHADLYGLRTQKYAKLLGGSFDRAGLIAVEPGSPFYLFAPQDVRLRGEYEGYERMSEVMPTSVLGFQTHRDDFAIDFDRESLRRRIGRFRDAELTQAQLEMEFGVTDNRDWRIGEAREALRKTDDWERAIICCSYRPFDSRPCYFSTAAMDYPRRELLDHVAWRTNLCLGLGRQGNAVEDPIWSLVAVSRDPMDANFFRRGGVTVFPLWLFADADGLNLAGTSYSNFSPTFRARLEHAVGLPLSDGPSPNGIDPVVVIQYAYAVFHSVEYRARYAEFLKIDFPRLPIPRSLALLKALSEIGRRLIALHLVESPEQLALSARFDQLEGDWQSVTAGGQVEASGLRFSGPAEPIVGRIMWADGTAWIADSSKGSPSDSGRPAGAGFHGVTEEVWNTHVGGFRVCEKWLKDRKGRVLAADDITHYLRIVVALSQTIRLMGEIDEIIDVHGGWPTAFQPATPSVVITG
jgi:predicted helicase